MMNDGPISSHLVHRVGCLILITTRAGGVEVDVVSRAPHLPLLAPEQTGVKQLWFVKYSVAFSILSHLSAPPEKRGFWRKSLSSVQTWTHTKIPSKTMKS